MGRGNLCRPSQPLIYSQKERKQQSRKNKLTECQRRKVGKTLKLIKMINHKTTKEEDALIFAIVERAEKKENNDIIHAISILDITACHLNGTPLDLQKFLDFDDFDFNHDFYGIRQHINRKTGKIEDRFLPKCSV